MAQPKIQQYQTDVTGGGGLASFVSVGKNTNQTIPTSTETAVTFNQETFDADGWFTLGGSTFTVPSGITKVKAYAFVRFVRQDGQAILDNRTMIMSIQINNVSLASGSIIGSGSTDVRSNCIHTVLPWTVVSTGQILRVVVSHSEPSTTLVPVASMCIEALE